MTFDPLPDVKDFKGEDYTAGYVPDTARVVRNGGMTRPPTMTWLSTGRIADHWRPSVGGLLTSRHGRRTMSVDVYVRTARGGR